ncbi:hypothetical protein POM88_003585 [Heracleum sosnowskyi]|uniref:RNase H type-1 domain-containing protein n=1 Tax=Heracleum sosnowskyi TaxID=360622 RepID=A0AAD8N6Z8_9APIA|nr:hypothetical protein POM88_003585 [Heracleum sosnowskyi]
MPQTFHFLTEGRYDFGGIIRDHMGFFVAGISGLREGIVLAEVAEVVALNEVLSWMKNDSIRVQQIETDCLVLVQTIRSKMVMTSIFGGVFEDCKQLLDSLSNV